MKINQKQPTPYGRGRTLQEIATPLQKIFQTSWKRKSEGPRPDDSESAIATDDKGDKVLSSQLAGLLLGGGAYETVIVILQDLAAVELEEAFDHEDVVVKLADTAQVVVDGGI